MLTHVNYRSGRMHDMALLTRWAHQAGALAVWDLAHSAGAVPLDLLGSAADFAIGCGYKYLNGGPGAPSFVWVHPRHEGQVWQPLTGWLGHAAPFEFSPEYRPAQGIQQYQCGTPAVLSMTALDTALDVFDAAAKLGGMGALRAKSLALTDAFIAEIDARVPTAWVATPREPVLRGSQVSIALPSDIDSYAVMQALISRGVIGDFRAGQPALLRFGFTPLYTRFVDVVDAVGVLVDVLASEAWRTPEFQRRSAVT
jgi:kynureninase